MYGGSEADGIASVKPTFDGGYILSGNSGSNDGDVHHHYSTYMTLDWWIVKINTTGDTLWERDLGGTQEDEATAVIQAADSSYVIVGNTYSTDGDVTGNHGGEDIWLVKLSQSGTVIWQKSLGGPGDESANDIKQTADGGYIIAGTNTQNGGQVTGNHGGEDVWLVKLDAGGNLQWQQSYGGSDSEMGRKIIIAYDGSYIVAGSTQSTDGDVSGWHTSTGITQPDCWLLHVSATGALLEQKCLGGSNYDVATSIVQTADGSLAASSWAASSDGDVTGNHGLTDFWLVKLKGFSPLSTPNVSPAETTYTLYPNPATDALYITNAATVAQVDVYAISGNLVKTITGGIAAGIDLHGLADGYYMVKLTTLDGGVLYKKVVVAR